MRKEVTSNYEVSLPLGTDKIKFFPKANIQIWEEEDGYFSITLNGKDFATNLFENEVEDNLEYLFSYINGCVDTKNGEDLFEMF